MKSSSGQMAVLSMRIPFTPLSFKDEVGLAEAIDWCKGRSICTGTTTAASQTIGLEKAYMSQLYKIVATRDSF